MDVPRKTPVKRQCFVVVTYRQGEGERGREIEREIERVRERERERERARERKWSIEEREREETEQATGEREVDDGCQILHTDTRVAGR